jgi:hypothetical protein
MAGSESNHRDVAAVPDKGRAVRRIRPVFIQPVLADVLAGGLGLWAVVEFVSGDVSAFVFDAGACGLLLMAAQQTRRIEDLEKVNAWLWTQLESRRRPR